MAVQPENIRTWEIGGERFDLEASLGTGIVYRNEFGGKLDPPYKGILEDDMLRIWHVAQPTITGRFAIGDDGTPALDGDGRPADDPAAPRSTVANPDYAGYDVEALFRIAWAMARSVNPEWGSPYRKGFKAFREEVMHLPAGMYEVASLYDAAVLELGGGIIFRRPEGQAGDVEPDPQETAEG